MDACRPLGVVHSIWRAACQGKLTFEPAWSTIILRTCKVWIFLAFFFWGGGLAHASALSRVGVACVQNLG